MKKLFKILLNFIRGEQNINKLIKRGLLVGENFKRMSGVVIDSSHCFHIEIGDNVTLAPRVMILAHDTSTYVFLGYTKVGNVKIGNNVFVGAGTIILPNVNIGDNVIIGAGSIVSKNIESNSVAVGSPAVKIKSLNEYLDFSKSFVNEKNIYSDSYTFRNKNFSNEMRFQLKNSAKKNKFIFVR